MARRDDDDKYTEPELRERLKRQIKASDKGGRPGQWSARKSQRLVQEYEKRGGGYRAGANARERRSLAEWQWQQWQTQTGSAHADRGSMQRYLPKEAWERLSPHERAHAERYKRAAEARGRQHAPWPPAVRRVMQQLRDERTTKAELYARARELEVSGRSTMSKAELEQAVRDRESRAGTASKRALYRQAQELDIAGRSTMSKAELEHAVQRAR